MALNHLDIGRGYVLNYDSKDIPLPSTIRQEVWDWSEKHGIVLEGHKYGVAGMDIWRIRDEEQRVRFILRWL
jgi:hypothetical protein